jgi:hypothetical protein
VRRRLAHEIRTGTGRRDRWSSVPAIDAAARAVAAVLARPAQPRVPCAYYEPCGMPGCRHLHGWVGEDDLPKACLAWRRP